MSETRRWDITAADRVEMEAMLGYETDIVAWDVDVGAHGVRLREVWPSHDEVYSDGVTVRMPRRVFREILAWTASFA